MSHFLESEGVPTTGISLVREHTELTQSPRFLWVPFEFGRPFGTPHAPDFQRRVLVSALNLLNREPGPVILEDFPEEAPGDGAGGDEPAVWSCPIPFSRSEGDRPEWVQETLDEMACLVPWHEVHANRRGRVPAANSGLGREEIVELLGKLAAGEACPPVASEHPTVEWIRLGCDDIRTWYLEAAQGQPGCPSAQELMDWFWQETSMARLIGRAALALLEHEDPMIRGLALRAMVPRQYIPDLMPGRIPVS